MFPITSYNLNFNRTSYPWQTSDVRTAPAPAPTRSSSAAELRSALRHIDELEKLLRSQHRSNPASPNVQGQPFAIGNGEATSARIESTARINAATDIDPDAAFGGSSRVTRIQGESGTVSGKAGIATNHAGYDGTGFVDFLVDEGSGVSLSANAADAGTHNLQLRYAAENYGEVADARTLSLYVNGVKDQVLSVPKTSTWEDYRVAAFSVDLAAGANTLEFRVDSGDTGELNIDYIELGANRSRAETELGTPFGDARVINGSSGSHIGYVNHVGDGYDMTVDAASSGPRDIVLRYATGETNPGLSLYVNGVKHGGLSFANTGGWGNFADLNVANVNLSAGANTITLRKESGDALGGVDIDYIVPEPIYPGLESGSSVTAGSFEVNGETIDVFADDSVNAVLARIDASAAGVDARFDSASQTIEIVSRTSGASATVTLGNDTSGFLQATRLDAASATPGRNAGTGRALTDVDRFAGVTSGTVRINDRPVAVDVQNDSLENLIGAINAADAGVIATLSPSAGSYRVRLAGDAPQLTLDDGGSGLFDALGFSRPRYGLSPAARIGSLGENLSWQIDRATRVRSYRAADALDDVDRAFGKLFGGSGSEAFTSALGSLIAEHVERFGSARLKKLGLDFRDDEKNLFDLGSTERRRFTRAVQLGDTTLLRLMLEGKERDGKGLLEAMRGLIENELANRGGSRRGLLLDTYA